MGKPGEVWRSLGRRKKAMKMNDIRRLETTPILGHLTTTATSVTNMNDEEDE
jgi:hypothetical protein